METRQGRFPWLGHAVVFCLIGLFTLSPVIWLAIDNALAAGVQIGLTDLMVQWGVVAAVHLVFHLRKRMSGQT